MKGIEWDEFYEWLTWNHDAEFEYNGGTYVLQPEWKENKKWLVIWTCPPAVPRCIARREIKGAWGNDVPRDAIEDILSTKCFEGKSFYDIEQDIEVTVIF